MKKNAKQPRKDVNQQAKQMVDSALERLNKAADAYQAKKEAQKKETKE
jgi:hypothetical protein